MQKKFFLFSCILIIISGLLVYLNSISGQFIWDDAHFIKDNLYLRSFSNLPKIFTSSMGAGAGIPRIYTSYRPLQIFTYLIEYSLWDLRVQGYHLTNIVLHILVGLLIFWLINLLFQEQVLSLFTAFLFVVHPVHTEAVAYISGRADSLASLFILLCFILYIKQADKGNVRLYLFMLFSYVFALLSRENSLILPLILLLYHYIFRKKLYTKGFFSICGLGFIYILLRLSLLKFLFYAPQTASSLWQRLPGFFVAVTNYLRLIIWPFNLHMEYAKPLFSFSHPQALLGMAIVFSSIIYVLRKKDLVSFSIFWFFLTLLPVANLYPVNAYMAEHWLYLPSIGLFLILAEGLTYLYNIKSKNIALTLAVILLGFYAFLTVRQNNVWREPLTLYQHTLKYAPASDRVHFNLANHYKDRGMIDDAIASYKKAIGIQPEHADAYNNLGIAYKIRGQLKLAEQAYRKAIEINSDYAQVYNNLGNIYYGRGQNQDALPFYQKALEINPDYAQAHNNIGNVYYHLGQKEKAIASYKKAIEIDSRYTQAYNNLAIIYYREKQYQLAIEYADKASKLGFRNGSLLRALQPYREK